MMTATLIVAGIGFLVLVAIVVGVTDAAQASAWRQIAAERRRQWEAKQQHEFHGIDDAWDDD